MSGDINWNVDEINLKDYDLPQRQLLLPDSPICPNLVKLFMQFPGLTVIPPDFFEHMPMLEVLDLSNTNIVSLPTSIARLSLLQELFLRDCCALIELPTQVGMLSKLKLFDIKGTELMFIPKEMGKLKDLEVLRVSLSQYAKDYIETNSDNETVIPQNIISELKQLKELSISICPEAEWWEEEVKDIQYELSHLENLETLRWYLPTNEVLQSFLLLERNHVPMYADFSNLRLTIGQHAQLTSCLPRDLENKFEEFRNCLKWINAEGSMNDVSKIMEGVEALFLSRHWTIEKLSTLNVTNLKYCLLAECDEMETLVEVPDDEDVETRIKNGEKVGLELLQYLSIHHMKKLKKMWTGPVGKDSLSKLTILALHSCPQLTSIFTISIAQNLSCLSELIVEDCPKVRSLISNESHNIKRGPIFPTLDRIFLLDLPELANIFGGLIFLEKLSTLLIYSCPKLQYVSIMELSHIEKIYAEIEWWNALGWDKYAWENIFVPLQRKRDLVEQIFEATNSLQHFHDILSYEPEDGESYSGSLSDAKGKATETDVFYSFEDVDRFSVSRQENDERKSSDLNDIGEQVITAGTSMEKGKGIFLPPEDQKTPKSHGKQKVLTQALYKNIFVQDLPSHNSEALLFDRHFEDVFGTLAKRQQKERLEQRLRMKGLIKNSKDENRKGHLLWPSSWKRQLLREEEVDLKPKVKDDLSSREPPPLPLPRVSQFEWSGNLRKELTLGEEELNRKMEEFIAKFNYNVRRERENS